MEVWKEVPGFNGRYLISSEGNIKTMITRAGRKGTLLKGFINNTGYRIVRLKRYDKGPNESFLVHRLVAMAFLPPPQKGKIEVDHIDGNPLNCKADNLQWVSSVENKVLAAKRSGRKYNSHPIVMFSPQGERFDFDYTAQAERFFGWPHGLIASYLRHGKEFIRHYYVKPTSEKPTFPSIQDLMIKGEYKEAMARYPDRGCFEIFCPWAGKEMLRDIAEKIRTRFRTRKVPRISVLVSKCTSSIIVTLSD